MIRRFGLFCCFWGMTFSLFGATWKMEEARLPRKIARPFFGVLGDTLYVLGGSYFEKNPNDGGVKQYSREIFALTLVEGKIQVRQKWDLPYPAAEGLSVVYRDFLLCIGGANEKGPLDMVRRFCPLPEKGVGFAEYPRLPVCAKMPAGGCFGDMLYVLAGNRLFALDLSQESDWVEKASLPGPPREQAAFAIQSGDQKKTGLYIFGGHRTDTEMREALLDTWVYDPATDRWTELHPNEAEKRSTIGSVAVPSGCETILMVGGYALEKWNAERKALTTLPPEERNALERKRFAAQAASFQWYKNIRAYHTVPNAASLLPDELPLATCGSAVGFLGNTLVVAGGEDKPASRTDAIQTADFTVRRHFGWLNWSILAVYLGVMLPFGWFFMKRSQGSAEDYFKGGGRIPWWVNGLSIYATMLSSITFIAIPTMVYLGDWRYYPNAVMIFVTALFVIHFYIPRFRKLDITCAYEYLEGRFNLFVRLFASSAFILFMIARSAVVMYIPSLALNAVAGIDLYTSIVLVGGMTLLYSAMGGMEAVVWSDFAQAVILLGGAMLVACWLIAGSGGWVPMTEVAWNAGKFRLWDLSWDGSQPVLWVAIIGGFAQHLTSYTSDQTVIQRYVTMTNTRDANRSLLLNGVMSIVGVALFYLIGTGLYTFYHAQPQAFDPTLYANDALFPTYMVTQLPAGVSGLLVAAIFAATVSTISSNFNSSAAAMVTDFFCRFSPHDKNSRAAFRASIVATLLTGILAIGFTLFLASLPGMKSLFDVFLTTIGVLTGGLGGLFFLGFFLPKVTSFGAIAGLFGSYLVNFVLVFDQAFGLTLTHKPHPLLYAALSLGTCILIGAISQLWSSSRTSTRTEVG
ncbi:MAG: sodium/solute symporter [Planctomycetia bacterium]|nr:sodium/solute symporter [Planctomycetia bacterium]